MKINVEFDSLDELNNFCTGIYVAPGLLGQCRCDPVADGVTDRNADEKKDVKAKKYTAKKEAAKDEPDTASQEASEGKETEKKSDTDKTSPAATETEPADSQKHTDAELKMLLSGKLKEGKKKEVKALFEKYGVSCLTDLIEKQRDSIDAVYAEAEVL